MYCLSFGGCVCFSSFGEFASLVVVCGDLLWFVIVVIYVLGVYCLRCVGVFGWVVCCLVVECGFGIIINSVGLDASLYVVLLLELRVRGSFGCVDCCS